MPIQFQNINSWISPLLGVAFLILLINYLILHKKYNAKSGQQQYRDEYIAMLVHDLRSPLSVVRGAIDILVNEKAHLSAENVTQLTSQIKITTEDLLKLVNNILDVSKIESGKFRLEKSHVDINMILQSEADYYLGSGNDKGITIKTELDSSVHKANVDVDKVKRVLNNLISNALKFTPSQGKIVISSKRLLNDLQISVSDTGMGISDKMKSQLFNKFVQIGKTTSTTLTTDGKGTGLGLYIARAIVESHGGKIWIEDNTPTGTKFIFTLPIN